MAKTKDAHLPAGSGDYQDRAVWPPPPEPPVIVQVFPGDRVSPGPE